MGTAGGSQSAEPALYVACAGEKANPSSSDPVERVSSKVCCVGAWRSQPTIDPKVMQEWNPGVEWGAPALGIANFKESLAKRDELLPIIKKWSPDELVSKDSPPIYFWNNWGLTAPPNVKPENYRVHSPLWALGFQKVAQARGATVYVDFPGHPPEKYKDKLDFFVQLLGASPK
jgi:hypothetical protein